MHRSCPGTSHFGEIICLSAVLNRILEELGTLEADRFKSCDITGLHWTPLITFKYKSLSSVFNENNVLFVMS